jgi:hypothetical protein
LPSVVGCGHAIVAQYNIADRVLAALRWFAATTASQDGENHQEAESIHIDGNPDFSLIGGSPFEH